MYLCANYPLKLSNGFRGIYFAKYHGWPGGGGEENGAGEKMKNEEVRKGKGERKKRKSSKERGILLFYLYMAHTFVDNCILT